MKNPKYDKDTTEVHLGGLNAGSLQNFGDFPNLQTVWINNNNLTCLEGLEANFRIKHLYAHNNRISQVGSSLEKLAHL